MIKTLYSLFLLVLLWSFNGQAATIDRISATNNFIITNNPPGINKIKTQASSFVDKSLNTPLYPDDDIKNIYYYNKQGEISLATVYYLSTGYLAANILKENDQWVGHFFDDNGNIKKIVVYLSDDKGRIAKRLTYNTPDRNKVTVVVHYFYDAQNKLIYATHHYNSKIVLTLYSYDEHDRLTRSISKNLFSASKLDNGTVYDGTTVVLEWFYNMDNQIKQYNSSLNFKFGGRMIRDVDISKPTEVDEKGEWSKYESISTTTGSDNISESNTLNATLTTTYW